MSNTIKPRTTTVTIYDGEDLARLAELDLAVKRAERADKVKREPLEEIVTQLERQLRTAEKTGGTRLLGQVDPLADLRSRLKEAQTERDALPGSADAVKVERDEFAAEAEQRGVKIVLIARPRLEWRALMKDHAPREDNGDDSVYGVNMETLPDALLPQSIDTAMSTLPDEVVPFLDSLSDYDYYDRLFISAFALNRGSAVADPTQRLLFASSRTSAATSS